MERERERRGAWRRGQLTSSASAGSTGAETNKSRYRHRDRYVLQDRSFDRIDVRSRLSIEAVIHACCLFDRSIDRRTKSLTPLLVSFVTESYVFASGKKLISNRILLRNVMYSNIVGYYECG